MCFFHRENVDIRGKSGKSVKSVKSVTRALHARVTYNAFGEVSYIGAAGAACGKGRSGLGLSGTGRVGSFRVDVVFWLAAAAATSRRFASCGDNPRGEARARCGDKVRDAVFWRLMGRGEERQVRDVICKPAKG